MKHCILIDGSGYLFRAYHALPGMTRSDGVPTHAALGFTQMLLGTAKRHSSDFWAVIFDAGRKSFRNEIYPQYKAHRPPPPDDLVPQFDMVRDISRSMSIPTIQMPGFEADDIIATYTRQAVAAGFTVEILSSDKDLMQLVTDQVHLFDPLRQRRFTPVEVEEKFGVPPKKLQDLLSLCGDSVDNVPGVPGIGVKTAALLIREYGDLETLLSQSGQIKQPKRRQSLEEFADQARLSRRLIELKEDVDVPIPVTELKRQPIDPEKMRPMLQSLEFGSLLRRMENSWETERIATGAPPKSTHVEKAPLVFDDTSSLSEWLSGCGHGSLGLDVISHPNHGVFVGFSFGNTEAVLSLSLPERAGKNPAFCIEAIDWGKLGIDIPVLGNTRTVRKIVFDAKQWVKMLFSESNAAAHDFIDLKSLDSLIRGTRAESRIEKLCQHHDVLPELMEIDNKKIMASVTRDDLIREVARRSRALVGIYAGMGQKLQELRMTTLYEHIERPLVPVVADMERRGIRIDRGALETLRDEFSGSLDQLSEQIFDQMGVRFNLASPKQLAETLTSRLNIERTHRTRSGGMSTDAEALEKLAEEGHLVAETILSWRRIHKLKTTYCDALLPYLTNEQRLRTEYTLQGAQTGRLSSNRPNLQNIPVRTVEGRKIREVFVASEGYRLVSLDYNQIELRLLADMADLEAMREAFIERRDIHAATAENVFGPPASDAEAATRRRQAKAINFGIIYGISMYGLARQIGVSRNEAKTFIENYHLRFPGIRKFMEKTIAQCKSQGYVETMFGRRIYLPDIGHSKPFLRQHAERQAINAPIQGTAADIIKRSMIKVAKRIRRDCPDVHLLLQVHDELVFEVPETPNGINCVDDIIALLLLEMETAAEPLREFSLPLRVDAGSGKNWDMAH